MPILPGFSSSVERWLLRQVFNTIGQPPIRVVLPDGVAISSTRAAPQATVLISDYRTLLGLLLDPETGFGDAYAEGRIQVQGNLLALLDAVYRSWPSTPGPTRYSRIASNWMAWWQANSPRGSRKNVHYHYDLSTDFYKLWLDRELVYTCAYFPSPTATLEQAQWSKMDYVCRKLQLQPGETVVEAGCGWGALALHMARHYGVSVKAFNLSHEQILFARRRAREEGLDHQVEFIEDDYRNISGRFDAFVSVGMLEHVGTHNYSNLGRVIHRCLGNSGRGFLHFIGRTRTGRLSRWIRKRIFPGGHAPTLREAIALLEPWNYALLDVENLRLHYAKTLEHWLDRFEKASGQIAAIHDERFLRTWRLYLAGSLTAFQTGTLQLYQVLFAGPECGRIQWTRAPLYAGEQPETQERKWIHAMS
ncbi:MAG: cyclopropane-fatty-acyl-phospholipid synthase [Acidobacteria bacterium]|nr:MAG: cyclopropane-fatty-acyl-phospholipid synthase [Acidobacteriota bacterium]